jgi:hypothetical protein
MSAIPPRKPGKLVRWLEALGFVLEILFAFLE